MNRRPAASVSWMSIPMTTSPRSRSTGTAASGTSQRLDTRSASRLVRGLRRVAAPEGLQQLLVAGLRVVRRLVLLGVLGHDRARLEGAVGAERPLPHRAPAPAH